MKKVFGIYVDGRLGNQMFEYAFIYARAKSQNGFFFLDQLGYLFYVPKYFELPSYSRRFNSLLTKFYQYTKSLFFTRVNEDDSLDFDNQKRCYYYKGYYQSVEYFYKYEEEIRREFRLKKSATEVFDSKYGDLYKTNKTIAVHVRRTDIVALPQANGIVADTSLPLQYYKDCFAGIDNLQDYKIVFATDDVEFVRQNFSFLPNSIIEANDEITDFQVLMHADIIIAANSSFAWWAAWLNTNPGKRVFAPKYWIGSHKNTLIPKHIFNKLNWVLR